MSVLLQCFAVLFLKMGSTNFSELLFRLTHTNLCGIKTLPAAILESPCQVSTEINIHHLLCLVRKILFQTLMQMLRKF